MASSRGNSNGCRCSKRITRHAAKLIESSGAPSSSLFVSLPQKRQSRTLTNGTITNAITDTDTDTDFNLRKKLDTKMFECYLEDLWSRISVDKRISYAYLDSLWFSLYKGRSTKSKVLQWIKKKQIFLRKYIFVPIICWNHWSLLILCHFGESRNSDTNQPCMLLLDSLQKMGPKRLEPQIRRFVRDIYRSEERKETDDFIHKIPLLIPKVPQQRSGEECGVFVLYFLYMFLQTAPDSFSQEGYPSFLNEDWFKFEDLESFGNEIHRLCRIKDSSAYPEDSGEDAMDIEQVVGCCRAK